MKEITYHFLKEVAEKTHHMVATKKWNIGQARSFMRHNCINTEAQTAILENAKNGMMLNWIRDARVTGKKMPKPDVVEATERLFELDPKSFQPWTTPPIWDLNVSMQMSTEPGMHQLFLGITQSIMYEIQCWCTMRGQYSGMRKLIHSQGRKVMDLHLSWCKIQPHTTDSLGGWVSENYLGFARIIPFVCKDLANLAVDPPFVEPSEPISKWKAEDCRSFCRWRRLPVSGKVADLRQRVRDNKDVPIVGPVAGPIDSARRLCLILWAFLSHLMGMKTPDEVSIFTIDQLVRVLLTCCDDFDKEVRPYHVKRTQPFWMTSFNFLCLLNIPKQVEYLGPVRNRWEGTVRGEGFLRVVKPAIISKRINWQSNLMLNLLRQKCLLQLKTIGE